jgi:two-component system OmpR family response regulator
LVADDSADSAEILALLLGHAGFDVAIAADGKQALTALGESALDALVIDIELPDIHGIEVARRVRETGFNGKIVAVSGRGDEATLENARVAGVDHYLVKPCDVQELIRLLSN